MKKKTTKIGWFFYDPKYKMVLLHRRDHRTSESKNMWDCFGGSIEKNEGQEEALLREIEEELDIRVPKQEITHLNLYNEFPVYYIHFHDWLTRAIRLGEGAGFAWFPIRNIQDIKDLTKEAKTILSKFEKKLDKHES